MQFPLPRTYMISPQTIYIQRSRKIQSLPHKFLPFDYHTPHPNLQLLETKSHPQSTQHIKSIPLSVSPLTILPSTNTLIIFLLISLTLNIQQNCVNKKSLNGLVINLSLLVSQAYLRILLWLVLVLIKFILHIWILMGLLFHWSTRLNFCECASRTLNIPFNFKEMALRLGLRTGFKNPGTGHRYFFDPLTGDQIGIGFATYIAMT